MAWAVSQSRPGLPRLLKRKMGPYGVWGNRSRSPLERLEQQSVPRDWIHMETGWVQNWHPAESRGAHDPLSC